MAQRQAGGNPHGMPAEVFSQKTFPDQFEIFEWVAIGGGEDADVVGHDVIFTSI